MKITYSFLLKTLHITLQENR